MIEKLVLQNFKCYKNSTPFQFGPLNLFTGANGQGKSTVFQAYLLLAQSVQLKGEIDTLYVNGSFVNLDLFEDLVYMGADSSERDKTFSIEVQFKNANKLELQYRKLSERRGRVFSFVLDGYQTINATQELGGNNASKDHGPKYADYTREEIRPLFKDTYFVSADRIGPSIREGKDDSYDYNIVGRNGEHRLNVLTEISKNVLLPNEEYVSLLDATNYWLKHIMHNVKLGLRGTDNSSSVLEMRLGKEGTTYSFKSINSGFGYSYILSVIETLLISPKGSMIFIENPEAHLHPAAQSRLCDLFHWAAINGKQLFIETHSEHILNGLKVRIVRNKKMNSQDFYVYFFDEDSNPRCVKMDENGFMDSCPAGFFDQASIDAAELFRLKYAH